MYVIIGELQIRNSYTPCVKVRGLKVSSKLKALRHNDNSQNISTKTLAFVNSLHAFNKKNGFVTEMQYYYIVKLYNDQIENK